MEKNRLQEYYQKQQLALPIYRTLYIGGPSHAPQFQSTVVLADRPSIKGQICNSKKEAEASAARQALRSQGTGRGYNQGRFTEAKSTAPMSPTFNPSPNPDFVQGQSTFPMSPTFNSPPNPDFVQVPSLSTMADSSMVRSFTKHAPIPVGPQSTVLYPPPQGKPTGFAGVNPQGKPTGFTPTTKSRPPATQRLVSPLPQKLLSPADFSNIEQDRPQKNKAVILVDVENIPRLAEQVAETHPEIDVYAFVGEHHGLSEKDFGPRVTKILTPGSQINGSDACIIMYATVFLMEKKYRTYYIGTRDKFGSALVELISNRDSDMPWTYRSAKLITNVNQL